MDQIRWGILGCGGIASSFASDLQHSSSAVLKAVASRDAKRARKFSETYGAESYHSSYEGLLDNPDVDAVYIATPHPFHFSQARMVIQAGKHVFCEKPVCMNTAQLNTLMAEAEKAGVFLGEAYWTAYFPLVKMLKELSEASLLGELLHIDASFCSKLPDMPEQRWLNPDLGGGSLLDIGIYPLAFSMHLFADTPGTVRSMMIPGSTGVDIHEQISLSFPSGGTAALTSSFRFDHPHVARIIFRHGSVYLPDFFHPRDMILYPESNADIDSMEVPDAVEMHKIDHVNENSPYDGVHFSHSFQGQGYQFEIEAVSRCLLELNGGQAPEEYMYGVDRSLEVLGVLDALRKDWNLVYPGETSI
ncbi:Gfo/Idh/MocA family protein [Salinispira pacifica]|nr:Gfo/Idh/MocA family oxidoreductase [Salinispira pacifica]